MYLVYIKRLRRKYFLLLTSMPVDSAMYANLVVDQWFSTGASCYWNVREKRDIYEGFEYLYRLRTITRKTKSLINCISHKMVKYNRDIPLTTILDVRCSPKGVIFI